MSQRDKGCSTVVALCVWTIGTLSAPDAIGAPSRVQFVDSGQRLGGNDYSREVALGDVDGDGDLDAMIAKFGVRSQLWLNQGGAQGGAAGTFLDSGQSLATGSSHSVALADLDGDRDLDAFFVDADNLMGAYQIWINQGGGQGGVPGIFLQNGQVIGGSSVAVALGELNGTPGIDAFVTSANKVWFNNGTGQFVDSGQNLGNQPVFEIALGDTDGDGDLDGFAVGVAENIVWLNQGGEQGGTAGTFLDSGQRLTNAFVSGQAVALGDLDGDGDIDAFMAGGLSHGVWTNQGGAFSESGQRFGGGDSASDIALGDLDNDGDLDAFVARFNSSRIYENDGVGNFTDAGLSLSPVSSFGYSLGVALGDLDGDGDLDAFISRHSEPNQVWLNQTPPPPPTFPEYKITTIAGNGTLGSSGDGGPAIQAQLSGPWDIAVDAHGNIFIAELGYELGLDRDPNPVGGRVRKVTPDGFISTFAGTGAFGSSGDGGPATAAQFRELRGVSVDSTGNVYILDDGNHRVRRVDTNGVIHAFAGTGARGFSGDGGPAAAAEFDQPTAIEVDKEGSVYIVDYSNHRIRKVDTNGTVTTVAGNGTEGFSGDGSLAIQAEIGDSRGLATDRAGNLFLSDLYFNDPLHFRVRRVRSNGIIITVAGGRGRGYSGSGGPAAQALLDGSAGVAVDEAGNLFIADSYNHRIRRVGTNGLIATVAGTGVAGFSGDDGLARAADLSYPRGLAVDAAGNVFLTTSNRVRRLIPTGRMLPFTSKYVSTPPPGAVFDFGSFEKPSINENKYAYRALHIGKIGVADLLITSLSLVGSDTGLSISKSVSGDPPHTLLDGVAPAPVSLEIKITLTVPHRAGLFRDTLRIRTNDPDRPVVDYPIVYDVTDPYGYDALEEVLLFLYVVHGRAALHSASQLTASGQLPLNDRERATLNFDPNAPHSLTSEVPSFLGGGSVQLSNFTGSVTVSLYPIPNDSERTVIRIDSGSFTAPSIQLPSGLATGANTLTFGPASQSDGILNRTSGEYTASATATIVNDLFPRGFPVRGSYRGTFDAATGRASVQSQSTDLFKVEDDFKFNWSAGKLSLTWMNGVLEEAATVLGPWKTLTNAASPHAVDTSRNEQQYFRLRLSAP